MLDFKEYDGTFVAIVPGSNVTRLLHRQKKMNIVVVENDTSLVKSLELVLKDLGHTVSGFADPLEAVGFIMSEGEKIEALIIDFLMPGMDGLTLLERTRGKLTADCRVIMISGYHELLATMALDTSGIHAILAKPVDLFKLLDLVEGRPVHS